MMRNEVKPLRFSLNLRDVSCSISLRLIPRSAAIHRYLRKGQQIVVSQKDMGRYRIRIVPADATQIEAGGVH